MPIHKPPTARPTPGERRAAAVRARGVLARARWRTGVAARVLAARGFAPRAGVRRPRPADVVPLAMPTP
ncbi:hypothetical protein GCM10010123_04090 [Pilimelia anulata]|uniref:Uncharacterized protein n=1 Tax=Pilimelia anulata TaxID=53371 RepID=A0A8J3B6I3_9ACTN|nr:hypothetical protein GCM10010123_04090 [Pilimelia anulata]